MSDSNEREWRFYIDDMIGFAEKAITYTAGLGQAAFVASGLNYDATLRNLELIGEAATRIPEAVRAANPQLPWRLVIATRNRLIHGYLGIDNDILWSIIQSDIPALLPQLRELQRADDMTEPTIICPNCKTEIRLTESLAAPLIAATRKQFEQQLSQKDEEIAKREQGIRDKEKQVTEAKRNLDTQVADQVAAQLKAERSRVIEEESKKAKQEAANELNNKARELAELREVLKVRDAKLAEAQQAQAELIKKQRELDDAKRELELTVEKRVQEGLGDVREKAKREAEEGLKLKVMEKDQTIASMQQKIEELKQKAAQGSQQLQGEVQELELESLLRAKFPFDSIEPVPKGEFGGDVLQRVASQSGQSSGTILWESKRTKNWSDGWLVKLREDQRTAKAEISVLVSQILPKGVEAFDVVDGVWVTSPRAALPVATVLRHTLLQVGMARQVSEGQQTKTEMIYQYLTGPRFRHRVEAIVEAFSTMQEDLEKERKAIMKQWAKREEQIERVMGATVGMYGDLQGIAGKSLQEIEGLELKSLGFEDDKA